LARPTPAYVVTTSEHAPKLEKQFPNQFKMIFRQRRFLAPNKTDEMVVLRFPKTS
jgi:hypothetical protein